MTTTTTASKEDEWTSRTPNDEMPAWVCAIGGYEVLLHSEPNHAKEWFIRYGMKRHVSIRAGAFLSRECHRLRGAIHYGFLWWGTPYEWDYEWPTEHQLQLALESEMRERTHFDKIFKGSR